MKRRVRRRGALQSGWAFGDPGRDHSPEQYQASGWVGLPSSAVDGPMPPAPSGRLPDTWKDSILFPSDFYLLAEPPLLSSLFLFLLPAVSPLGKDCVPSLPKLACPDAGALAQVGGSDFL